MPTLNRLLPDWRDKKKTGLNQVRREVLLNMSFNMGHTTFKKFKLMWRAVKARDWEEAANQMLNSVWAEQVGIRADELADAMRRGKFGGRLAKRRAA